MSVINQVLRDLDERQTRPSHSSAGVNMLKAIQAGQRMPLSQGMIWATFLCGVLACFAVVWNHGRLQPGMTVAQADRTQQLRRAFTQLSAAKASAVTGAAWRVLDGESAELILTLQSPPQKIISQETTDGVTGFVFPGTRLATTMPAAGHPWLDYSQWSQHDGDLHLQLRVGDGVTMTSSLHAATAQAPAQWHLQLRKSADAVQPAVTGDTAATTVAAPPPKPVERRRNTAPAPSRDDAEQPAIRRPAQTQENAQAAYQRAQSALQRHDTVTAITALQRALRSDADLRDARQLLANLYMQTGREAEAFIVLQQGLELHPDDTALAYFYAQSLATRGQLQPARNVLLGVADAARGSADHHALLAAVNQRLGEHQLAAASYMQALELQPAQSSWWLGLAISLEALRQRQAAMGAYNEALHSGGLAAPLQSYARDRLAALGEKP